MLSRLLPAQGPARVLTGITGGVDDSYEVWHDTDLPDLHT